MKIRFIINPIAGTGKQKGIEKVISNTLNNQYDIVYTQKQDDATLLSKKAILDKINIVIAVGGDGTVNECAKALIGSDTALGIIPCGSGNGFAYHFGIKKNIQEALIQLNYCKVKCIDSCTVNEFPFVNISGIGFDAHIAKLFTKMKKRGFMNYVKIILQELMYKSKTYKLIYNGVTRNVDAYFIAFANASQYGNDAIISSTSIIDDGVIDFVIVKKFPRWKIPLFLYKMMKGELNKSKHVEIIQSPKMLIESKENLIHVDGEPKTIKNPIEIKIHSKSFNIFTIDE